MAMSGIIAIDPGAMPDPIAREILLAFWKVHILHHADEQPVYGQWVLHELRRHGFDVSPGTLYPLLARMVRHGWLRPVGRGAGSSKARRSYVLTRDGAKTLGRLREQVAELYREVILEAREQPGRGGSRSKVRRR